MSRRWPAVASGVVGLPTPPRSLDSARRWVWQLARCGTFCAALTQAGTSQPGTSQQPVLRGGVELILVDATVLDSAGRSVPDLLAADFTIVANGQGRKLVSAEYIASGTALGGPAVGGQVPVAGRSIFIAVDVEEIRAGEGRGLFATIGEYLDQLLPIDRVGLISLPLGVPRIDPGFDRSVIRSGLTRFVGLSPKLTACEPTLGEAAAISAADSQGMVAYNARASALRCPPASRTFASHFIEAHRRHTRDVLKLLGTLAESMASLPGRKVILLVSEGLFSDEETRSDREQFAAALDRFRVSLYALHMDFPFVDASLKGGVSPGGVSNSLTRTLDDKYGFDAMADAAFVTGGMAFRVVGLGTNILNRINAELAGYYILAFERATSDRDNRPIKVQVKVRRPDLDVRARQIVVPRRKY
jgi:VWFA-related protein